MNNEFDVTTTTNADGSMDVSFTIYRNMVEKLTKDVWKKLKKHINVKGFRKGKIKQKMVENRVSKSKLYPEVLCSFANIKFMTSHNNKIVFTNGHSVNDIKGGGCIVKFKAWEEPKVKLGDNILDNLDFQIPFEFDENTHVQSRLERFAKLHPYLHNKQSDSGETLPAESGDMVEVKIDCIVDGARFKDGCEESTNIRLIDGMINPPELCSKLIGIKPGDFITLSTNSIPKAFEKELAGKTMKLNINVNHVYTCEEAKIDDDMATTAGYKNLNEWIASLRSTATKIIDGYKVMAQKQAILNHVCSNSTIGNFPKEWAEVKATEIKDKDPDAPTKIEEVSKQIIILKAIGEKVGVEWDDKDKDVYAKNESVYAHKVLDYLMQKAKFTYVNQRTKENDRGNQPSQVQS